MQSTHGRRVRPCCGPPPRSARRKLPGPCPGAITTRTGFVLPYQFRRNTGTRRRKPHSGTVELAHQFAEISGIGRDSMDEQNRIALPEIGQCGRFQIRVTKNCASFPRPRRLPQARAARHDSVATASIINSRRSIPSGPGASSASSGSISSNSRMATVGPNLAFLPPQCLPSVLLHSGTVRLPSRNPDRRL